MITRTVDRIACGGRKTTRTIYGLLRTKWKECKIIIVSGSIDLQKQYLKEFPHQITINSETSKNVINSLTDAIENNEKLINITHNCFTMIPHNHFLDNDYHVIIDEDISNVISMKQVKVEISTKINFNWEKQFKLVDHDGMKKELNNPSRKLSNSVFYELQCNNRSNNNLTNSIYKDITDSNYSLWITPYDYSIMTNHETKAKDKQSFYIGRILKPETITKWKYMHIASAAFDNTMMAYWLRYYNIEYKNISDFIPHKGNIKLHIPNPVNYNGKFQYRFSNNIRKNDASILKQVHVYIERVTNGRNVLTLRNNDELSELSNEIRLRHNIHGINNKKLIECTDISIESAIIPNQKFKSLLKQTLFSHLTDSKEFDKSINHAYCCHLFYQAIMRCKLRSHEYNNEEINIFVMDDEIADAIRYYFSIDDNDIIKYDINLDNIKPKKAPMTSAEKQRKYREKHNIIKEKKIPMTSTERKRKSRASKKDKS